MNPCLNMLKTVFHCATNATVLLDGIKTHQILHVQVIIHAVAIFSLHHRGAQNVLNPYSLDCNPYQLAIQFPLLINVNREEKLSVVHFSRAR
jgi:hypothetical protein